MSDPSSIPQATVELVPAREEHLAAINDIYNYFVQHSTCTYQEQPEPLENRRQWLAHHVDPHPVIVAVENSEVVGWGSLTPYHPRSAYRFTVENSIYIHHARHRRGIGSRLLAELILRARASGHHTIIAGIDSAQTGSLALHAAHGFQTVGHLKQVGFKFGRWLDVIYMQRML